MILIISEQDDKTTDRVQDWLNYLKKKHVRINTCDEIEVKEIVFSDTTPTIYFSINGGATIHTNMINSYWYRRGEINIDTVEKIKINLQDKNLEILAKDNLQSELLIIKQLFFSLLERKTNNTLGSYYRRHNNKLIHLSFAKSAGLLVPETIICSNKKQALKFYTACNSTLITKPINRPLVYAEEHKLNGHIYGIYTSKITENDIKKIPESFFPSTLQKNIDKKIELRIFYLRGKCYTMAIFSQGNEKTNTDFRKYDRKNPNFNVPFNLPNEEQKKIRKFMNSVKLDTGSIDMIYTPDGKYYFLEVNPVGQFGIVSYSCNYNLEKKIALELSKN